MKRTLKKYFIPAPENNHQPVILRPAATLTLVGVVLVAELVFLIGTQVLLPRSKLLGLVLPMTLVEETNKSRLNQGEGVLSINPKLVAAAQAKAEDMAKRDYFAHVTPDGRQPWYWLINAGYLYQAAGENLAVNFVDSRDVVQAWLNSPSHRANILNNNFTEIGIATAVGRFQGRTAVYVVQFFGRPTAAEAASVNLAVAEPNKVPVPTVAVTNNNLTPTVRGAAISTTSTSRLAQFLTRPRQITGVFYFILSGLVLAALLLSIFIKIRIQHPVLIINGLLLLVLLLLLILANQQLLLASARIN